jgi:very-short-patch-repair endonuclease
MDSTDAERLLWRHLRRYQMNGHKFRRQQPIGIYIVDFVCLDQKLVIELDGGQHAEQVDYDETRTAWLESQGFRVLRFWNNQVLAEVEAVKTVIWEVLQSG